MPRRTPPAPSVHSIGRTRSSLRVLVGLALVVALGLGGCGSETGPPADVIVTIDGERILVANLEAYFERIVDADELELDDATSSRLFDEYLDGQLLVRLAIERGLVEGDVDPRRAAAYLLRGARQPIDRAEAEAYYRAHRSDFEHAEQVRLRQILVPERSLADEALTALAAGEEFAEVAARLSQGPKAHLGGDQGLLARADLPERFADLIFELPPGELSPIVENDYGFQIFQVVELQPAERVPLEQALPDIERRLERMRVDEAVAGFVDEARERYTVRLYPDHFPFDYRGSYATSDADQPS